MFVIKRRRSSSLRLNTPPSARRRIIQRFRNGEITVLLNYMISTTGFDSPAIDSAVILRKYNSEDLPVIQQMIGRGLRGPFLVERKNALYYRGEIVSKFYPVLYRLNWLF